MATKKKYRPDFQKRFKAVTMGMIVYHRLSMGWDENGVLEFDVCFKNFIGADSLNGELRRLTVERAFDIRRHWAVQVNIYCSDGATAYIESCETNVENSTLDGIGEHVAVCKNTALDAVNPKHIRDIEWIAHPIKDHKQELTVQQWAVIHKNIARHLARAAA